MLASLELPHWLIIAGAFLVVAGFVGVLVSGKKPEEVEPLPDGSTDAPRQQMPPLAKPSRLQAKERRLSIQRKVDMRAHRTFLSFAIAMGCGITLQSTAFSQEYWGTWAQQQACTPDVWRLCGAQIPDANRIVACLRRNTPQLSDRCRAVFEQSDIAPPRREDRDYGQRRYDRDYRPRPYDRDYGPRPYYDDE